ncbi:sulfate ABC transporter permease subunit CysT [Shewanella oneidensis MR-1]|uniref:Sulfate transport system permease protein CysT n=1 Tax=Shewanella oneidensis (strain ATCC 700550 / JCM 31522 / CIP 106686 / LMG 19005 / NCIMB 14063 / MR-1) TaxID=211586 RepID=Q8E8L0_SHEON|nr:sulfate ABC transporter permease subunit CysT [Shewanella oneidensis]AAN57613.2 ABC-type sulfate/thiosulfate uptakesystem permease component 1 CysT [Shewanella oneidensis MR-1]MDX5998108.1 sulfate ABC transporter permease subunit CysT [Shewanella oneidensis]MEE2026717.1 Sulfate transport system permease protein CysT [Shewanella oneidensis]QKG94900.1 sulfate ABC transporter permease subunit CysT [Shewanella oneidensis MR-1]
MGKAVMKSVLPGFGITLGFSVLYLSLLFLLPVAGLILFTLQMSWADFWVAISHPQVVASYKLSFAASFIGATINAVFGTLVAWVLVRYQFLGKKVVDALVDLPFALPTAVAGIALVTLYSTTGWVGQYLYLWGIKVAYSEIGVVIALTYIGLPFVVRTVQPVLADFSKELEEASASLGASRFTTIKRVILPAVLPALLTGYALAFARAVGEYGSVIFISGNLPYRTEITPLLIVSKAEQYDYNGAAAIGVVMLAAAFILLLIINSLQWWASKRG